MSVKGGATRVVLNGAYGEGGGSLVRTALAMSAITQQGVSISQVRSGTRYPGLDVEDLALLSALKEVTGADVSDVYAGGDGFTFDPKHPARSLEGTVGAPATESRRHPNALILLNTLHSVLVHSGAFSTVTARGETFGNNTLSYDSFDSSTLEALRSFGCYAYPTLQEAAFGRESQGAVLLDIEPSYMEGVDWSDRESWKRSPHGSHTRTLPRQFLSEPRATSSPFPGRRNSR